MTRWRHSSVSVHDTSRPPSLPGPPGEQPVFGSLRCLVREGCEHSREEFVGQQAFDVAVPRDEWERVTSLLGLVTHDETSGLGFVRLRSDGHRRRWYATDSYRAAVLEGEPDGRTYDVALSPHLVRFGSAVSNWGADVCVRVETDGDELRVGVWGDDAWMWTVDQGHDYLDFDGVFPDDDELRGTATVESGRLSAMAVAAQHERRSGDDEQRSMWLEISDGEISGSVYWGADLGAFDYRLNVDNARGKVAVRVNPRYLETLLDVFPHDAEVQVGFPRYVSQPVVFTDGAMTALLMPVRTPEQVLRDRVEEVINDVVGHLGVVRDDDGDYPLLRRGTPVYARLLFVHDPSVLQVFAVLVDDIAASAELYSELNDLNASSTFARLFHIGEQVLAEVDLAAHSLDAHELRVALNRILTVANEIVPTLSAVLGGIPVNDQVSRRFQNYRNTVVEAEVTPGVMVPITGPDAVAPWPFPGVVHVITGWNPQGVVFDQDRNDHINREIAKDIIAKGGRFVHGVGREAHDPDGYAEPSLVAWGLERDQAISMGHRASQDAIFEITDSEVRLVSCFDDHIDVWSRGE